MVVALGNVTASLGKSLRKSAERDVVVSLQLLLSTSPVEPPALLLERLNLWQWSTRITRQTQPVSWEVSEQSRQCFLLLPLPCLKQGKDVTLFLPMSSNHCQAVPFPLQKSPPLSPSPLTNSKAATVEE